MTAPRVRRWWHCLRGMFSGHQAVTCYDRSGQTTLLACMCGRMFWRKV